MTGLSPAMLQLFQKRVIDIAAVTDQTAKKLKITYNDQVVPIKNFQQYIDLYIGSKGDAKRIYESGNERWEYAVALAPNHEFAQVSFVNGICTNKPRCQVTFDRCNPRFHLCMHQYRQK